MSIARSRRRTQFYSVFRSGCIVSCGCKVVGAFGGCEDVDKAPDGGPKALDGAFGGLAQECFQFGEGLLDRVEVRAVRRQVEELCARRLDQGSHPWPLVAGQVVQDHDIAQPQGGHEDLLNIGLERRAVDRPIEHEGRHKAARAQPGHKGGCLPAPVRDTDPKASSPRSPPVAPGHGGGSPGLVEEHQPLGIEVELALEPGRASLADIRAVLLGRVRGLFLRVIWCRRQKRQSALTLTRAPFSAKRAFNSGRVMSGTSAKAAWIRSAWPWVRPESRSPPCGLGRASPPARRIPCQRMALEALTPNPAAAWGHDRPASMAARTRERRSKDSAWGIQAGLPCQPLP